MNYAVGLIGMWVFADAIYSLSLYLTADGHNGQKQSWRRDHWVRVIRAICGIALMVIGALW